jgi:hypothetical protein
MASSEKMTRLKTDYYDLFRVDRQTSGDEIKKVYRRNLLNYTVAETMIIAALHSYRRLKAGERNSPSLVHQCPIRVFLGRLGKAWQI